MAYTILQPSFFSDSWLAPPLGFDHPNRRARIYGDGTVKHAWIHSCDVALYIVGAVDNDRAHPRQNRTHT